MCEDIVTNFVFICGLYLQSKVMLNSFLRLSPTSHVNLRSTKYWNESTVLQAGCELAPFLALRDNNIYSLFCLPLSHFIWLLWKGFCLPDTFSISISFFFMVFCLLFFVFCYVREAIWSVITWVTWMQKNIFSNVDSGCCGVVTDCANFPFPC